MNVKMNTYYEYYYLLLVTRDSWRWPC